MSEILVPHILALDFDGVVCDSIGECMTTSHLAYCEVSPHLPLECPSLWQSLFRARRGVVRPSGHYLLLWDWITRFPDRNLSPHQFEQLGCGQELRIKDFERLFHSLRDAAINDDPDRFVHLNPLYPGVVESWPALRQWPLYIVSTKDEPSIRLILSRSGLEVDGIFGRGVGPKPESLLRIAAAHRSPPDRVVFVDDNALHVADAASVGVTAVLANWGYGPREPAAEHALDCFSEIAPFVCRLGPLR
jgi:phosphoglycolate phosphatase-like HAD superfamily hydrolase